MYIKGSPESKEKLGQASSIKSAIECIFKKLASLDVTDECQDTKDISNTYVEVPPINDSSVTKLDKVLESAFARENEGLSFGGLGGRPGVSQRETISQPN